MKTGTLAIVCAAVTCLATNAFGQMGGQDPTGHGAENDLCADAVALEVPVGGSASAGGSTVEATLDGVACVTPTTAPGVWYRVVGHGTVLAASTCNQADYDTRISVFCGECLAGSDCCIPNGTPGCETIKCNNDVCREDVFCCDVAWDAACAELALSLCDVCDAAGLPCVDGGDDTEGCGVTTEVTWCAKAGAIYFILVHGAAAETGDFTLTVSDLGAPCMPAVDCPVICETDADCPDGYACTGGECVPLPTGACCQCDGPVQFCTVETEADCLALDGLYLGDDAGCEDAACAVAYPGQCSCDEPTVECWVEVFPSASPAACEGDCCILLVGWDVSVPDGCAYTAEAIIDIGCEQIEITNGQLVYLDCGASSCTSVGFGNLLRVWADFADLTVTVEDSGGNTDSCFEALCEYCYDN